MAFTASPEGHVEQIGTSAGGEMAADMAALGPVFSACAVGRDMATPQGLRSYEDELVRTVWTRGPTVPHVMDLSIDLPGRNLQVRVYRPDVTGEEELPAIIWFHGGGLLMGGLESDDMVCRAIAKAGHCVIYNVDYRLAPEHPYPAAHDDAVLACRAIMNDPPGGPVDRSRIVIAGYSGGGCISAAACQAAVSEGWGRPVGQILLVPLIDFTAHYSAAKRSEADARNSSIYVNSYFQDPATDRADPRISPLWADDFSKLPPTFILTGELDPRRTEAEVYARNLQSAGVPVQIAMAFGMPHLFLHLSDKVANAMVALDRTIVALRHLLA